MMMFRKEGRITCYKCLKEIEVQEAFVLATDDYGSLMIGHYDCEDREVIE